MLGDLFKPKAPSQRIILSTPVDDESPVAACEEVIDAALDTKSAEFARELLALGARIKNNFEPGDPLSPAEYRRVEDLKAKESLRLAPLEAKTEQSARLAERAVTLSFDVCAVCNMLGVDVELAQWHAERIKQPALATAFGLSSSPLWWIETRLLAESNSRALAARFEAFKEKLAKDKVTLTEQMLAVRALAALAERSQLWPTDCVNMLNTSDYHESDYKVILTEALQTKTVEEVRELIELGVQLKTAPGANPPYTLDHYRLAEDRKAREKATEEETAKNPPLVQESDPDYPEFVQAWQKSRVVKELTKLAEQHELTAHDCALMFDNLYSDAESCEEAITETIKTSSAEDMRALIELGGRLKNNPEPGDPDGPSGYRVQEDAKVRQAAEEAQNQQNARLSAVARELGLTFEEVCDLFMLDSKGLATFARQRHKDRIELACEYAAGTEERMERQLRMGAAYLKPAPKPEPDRIKTDEELKEMFDRVPASLAQARVDRDPDSAYTLDVPLESIYDAANYDKMKLDRLVHLDNADIQFFNQAGWDKFDPESYAAYLLPELGSPRYFSGALASVVIPLAGQHYRMSFEDTKKSAPYSHEGRLLRLQRTNAPESIPDAVKGHALWRVFGQPRWLQSEHYPADRAGNPCYHLVTLENKWGDSGNWNILVSLGPDGLPNHAYFEASNC
jgi:hypothetical protein